MGKKQEVSLLKYRSRTPSFEIWNKAFKDGLMEGTASKSIIFEVDVD